MDSLPESCFDSGLSTLRDPNEYDSEVEYKPQQEFKRSHGAQESLAGDASDTDVSSGTQCCHSPYLSLKSSDIVLSVLGMLYKGTEVKMLFSPPRISL